VRCAVLCAVCGVSCAVCECVVCGGVVCGVRSVVCCMLCSE